ncbi:uncharacterized protein L201_004418 [Kwoniella dendrophila CBS 6074]|uniref:Alpha 1,4-glycosyltransferase domain-containing protein n=1 Tax=Kwoniella dendrophila CBS 6074 TaxID=1295534 RepID=A0AAX4JX84_9TREE
MSVFRRIWNDNSRDYVPMTNREGRSQPYHRYLTLKFLPSLLILAVGIIIGSNHPLYLSIYSRRPLESISLLPNSLPPLPPSLSSSSSPSSSLSSSSSSSSLSTINTLLESGNLPIPKEDIPNLVHYVYGLSDDPDEPDFPYFAYLSIRSTIINLNPKEIWFHCINEPKGYWWNQIRNQKSLQGDPIIKLKKARNVDSIGKDQRPVTHFAHKADIIRLEVLRDYGGIYLDIDTFVLRSFADYGLLRQDVVLGMEAHGLTFLRGLKGDDEMNPKGLCNAIIIARKESEFIQRWLDSYEGFRSDKWTEHSVEMPWTLAKLYPTLLTILSERAFFWPLWTDDHIHAVYETTEYDFENSGQLAYHAWESKARPYLSALNPTSIHQIDTSFTRMAKQFVEPDEEKRWIAHLATEGSDDRKTGLDEGSEEAELEQIGDEESARRGGRSSSTVKWTREVS